MYFQIGCAGNFEISLISSNKFSCFIVINFPELLMKHLYFLYNEINLSP